MNKRQANKVLAREGVISYRGSTLAKARTQWRQSFNRFLKLTANAVSMVKSFTEMAKSFAKLRESLIVSDIQNSTFLAVSMVPVMPRRRCLMKARPYA